MARGLIGGMTDYSHQSFDDIITDLTDERNNTIAFIKEIEDKIKIIDENSYLEKVPYDFKAIVGYSLKHYKTTVKELEEIINEIQIEVREHHCKRLQKISKVAQEINVDIGKIWHQQYGYKEYGESNFRIVERIYGDTRDMAVNLLDISNIAGRLTDFIGRTKVTMEKKQDLGGISNTTFGDNATIIVGDHNSVKNHIEIKQGNFEDLKDLLSRNKVSEEDVNSLKEILEKDKPNEDAKVFGSETNSWIGKMVSKCLDGSWSIGIGAAGKLLADGIKAYYGWPT